MQVRQVIAKTLHWPRRQRLQRWARGLTRTRMLLLKSIGVGEKVYFLFLDRFLLVLKTLETVIAWELCCVFRRSELKIRFAVKKYVPGIKNELVWVWRLVLRRKSKSTPLTPNAATFAAPIYALSIIFLAHVCTWRVQGGCFGRGRS